MEKYRLLKIFLSVNVKFFIATPDRHQPAFHSPVQKMAKKFIQKASKHVFRMAVALGTLNALNETRIFQNTIWKTAQTGGGSVRLYPPLNYCIKYRFTFNL